MDKCPPKCPPDIDIDIDIDKDIDIEVELESVQDKNINQKNKKRIVTEKEKSQLRVYSGATL